MIELKRTEWHQVSVELKGEITLDMVQSEFPEITDDDTAAEKLTELSNSHSADELAELFYEQLEWEEVYVDWWSDRKGSTDIEHEYSESST